MVVERKRHYGPWGNVVGTLVRGMVLDLCSQEIITNLLKILQIIEPQSIKNIFKRS